MFNCLHQIRNSHLANREPFQSSWSRLSPFSRDWVLPAVSRYDTLPSHPPTPCLVIPSKSSIWGERMEPSERQRSGPTTRDLAHRWEWSQYDSTSLRPFTAQDARGKVKLLLSRLLRSKYQKTVLKTPNRYAPIPLLLFHPPLRQSV